MYHGLRSATISRRLLVRDRCASVGGEIETVEGKEVTMRCRHVEHYKRRTPARLSLVALCWNCPGTLICLWWLTGKSAIVQ